MQRKRSRAPVALVPLWLIISGLGLVIALVVFFVIVPRVIASKVTEAADKRALAVQFGSASWKVTRAELSDVVITPRGTKAIVVTAKLVDARLSGLSPSWIILPAADVQIAGPFDSVLRAIEPVRTADEKLPTAERMPIDVTSGAVQWKKPFGDGSSIAFGTLGTWIRPAESRMQIRLGKGRVELPQVVIEPLAVDLTRTTAKGERIDLIATLGAGSVDEKGSARLEAHRTRGSDGYALDADLTFDALGLGTLSPKLPGLDLEKAILEGDATVARTETGAVSSRGKLVFTKIRLPPVVVGPVSAAIGGTVRVSWKGSPKKGAPGVMKLDEGKVEVTLGGKARVVRLGGEVSVGEEGEGPFLVAIDWEVGPIACSEIASDLAAGVGGGLVKGLAGAVSGNVVARGKVKGDLAALDAMKVSIEVQEACKIEVDLAKGASGLLKQLPF